MTDAEAILDRALALVAGGHPRDPLGVLAHIADPDGRKSAAQQRRIPVGTGKGMVSPDGPGHMQALAAVDLAARAEGAKNLVAWYGMGQKTREQVIALFQEALFNVQLGG